MAQPTPFFLHLWIALSLAAPLHASAQAAGTPYRLQPTLDAPVMGVSAVVWWVPSLFQASFVAADGCSCRVASLNGLDRPFAGTQSKGFNVAGQVLIAAAYTSTLLLDLIDVVKADQATSSFLVDVAVLAEAVLLNGAINEIAKIGAARPRPLLYGREPNDPLFKDPDNYVSFYSAHTSTAFALGLAYAQTFAYRHPDSPYRFLVYAGAVALGGTIGATRIAAGKHFPSDVLVGAAAGTAIGLSIPWLHRQSSGAQLSIAATRQSFGVALTATL